MNVFVFVFCSLAIKSFLEDHFYIMYLLYLFLFFFKVINCPKLPRCSDMDRDGFTGFATRELTEDPNRKVPAKWKGNASEPRCTFSETIQSVVTSTLPGSQSRRPQSTGVGCGGPRFVDPAAQGAEVPSRRDQTTWTSQDSRKVLSVFPF